MSRCLTVVGLTACFCLMGRGLTDPQWAVASDIDPSTGNPMQNYEPSSAVGQCEDGRNSSECITAWAADITAVRANEGVGPISLPLDFGGLSAPEQLLTLTNLERVDRGLSPIAGLSPLLDVEAEEGAAAATDPNGPDEFSWGSNWASSSASLYNDFAWMYDDGPGSFNLACKTPEASGCWGHRDNILRDYAEPIGMGAGAQSSGQTQLFVSAYTPAALGGTDMPIAPPWSTIAQTLPVGITSNPIVLTHGATNVNVAAWASGEPMNITAAIGDGWSITPMECQLAAGSSCQLTLVAPASQTSTTTSLTLNGPNGAQSIAVDRHIAVELLARLARSSIRPHHADLVSGEVIPAALGQRVALELRRAGRWSVVANATLGAHGRVRYSIRPVMRGIRHYRLHEPAADGYEEATSGSLALRVASK